VALNEALRAAFRPLWASEKAIKGQVYCMTEKTLTQSRIRKGIRRDIPHSDSERVAYLSGVLTI
jgi:hypothetical protein